MAEKSYKTKISVECLGTTSSFASKGSFDLEIKIDTTQSVASLAHIYDIAVKATNDTITGKLTITNSNVVGIANVTDGVLTITAVPEYTLPGTTTKVRALTLKIGTTEIMTLAVDSASYTTAAPASAAFSGLYFGYTGGENCRYKASSSSNMLMFILIAAAAVLGLFFFMKPKADA